MNKETKRISSEAIRKATGRSWTEWFLLLDSGLAYELDHKGIVAFLENHIDDPWWRQMVAVEYEKLHGLRVTGETADGSFQAGAQKSLPIAPKNAWELLISTRGMKAWLGDGVKPAPTKDHRYTTDDGIEGEFRVVKKMSHLRLTWQPTGWEKTSTLQVRVIPKGRKKSVISFHHEGLPGEKEREEMKRHWQEVLKQLEELSGA